MQIFYADGVRDILVAKNGTVRIEFGSVPMPSKKDASEQEVQLEPSQQMVLPIDGFLKAFSAMEQMVKELVDKGLVTRQEGAPQVAVTKQ